MTFSYAQWIAVSANRECGYLLSASQSISALFQGCSLQKTWLPQSLASEGVIWTWNNLSLSGQRSGSFSRAATGAQRKKNQQ